VSAFRGICCKTIVRPSAKNVLEWRTLLRGTVVSDFDIGEKDERIHRGLVSTPDARRLCGGCSPRTGAQCFHRRVGHAGFLRSLALGPEHQPEPFVLSAAERRSVVQRQKGQLDLADHFGQSGRANKLALTEWTTDRTGLPFLRDALAWFECRVVNEHPAGDHVLVLGKVIDGKLLDVEAEPMCYRETGAMDGASALYPEVIGES
jgi:hypothetical protein